MNKNILILIGLLASSLCMASDLEAKDFSDLNIKKSKESVELEIAKLQLAKLKIQDEINRLSGASKETPNSLKIKVKDISIFNQKSQAVIDVDGKSKTYQVNDMLKPYLQVVQISPKVVEILNTQTNTKYQYLLD